MAGGLRGEHKGCDPVVMQGNSAGPCMAGDQQTWMAASSKAAPTGWVAEHIRLAGQQACLLSGTRPPLCH